MADTKYVDVFSGHTIKNIVSKIVETAKIDRGFIDDVAKGTELNSGIPWITNVRRCFYHNEKLDKESRAQLIGILDDYPETFVQLSGIENYPDQAVDRINKLLNLTDHSTQFIQSLVNKNIRAMNDNIALILLGLKTKLQRSMSKGKVKKQLNSLLSKQLNQTLQANITREISHYKHINTAKKKVFYAKFNDDYLRGKLNLTTHDLVNLLHNSEDDPAFCQIIALDNNLWNKLPKTFYHKSTYFDVREFLNKYIQSSKLNSDIKQPLFFTQNGVEKAVIIARNKMLWKQIDPCRGFLYWLYKITGFLFKGTIEARINAIKNLHPIFKDKLEGRSITMKIRSDEPVNSANATDSEIPSNSSTAMESSSLPNALSFMESHDDYYEHATMSELRKQFCLRPQELLTLFSEEPYRSKIIGDSPIDVLDCLSLAKIPQEFRDSVCNNVKMIESLTTTLRICTDSETNAKMISACDNTPALRQALYSNVDVETIKHNEALFAPLFTDKQKLRSLLNTDLDAKTQYFLAQEHYQRIAIGENCLEFACCEPENISPEQQQNLLANRKLIFANHTHAESLLKTFETAQPSQLEQLAENGLLELALSQLHSQKFNIGYLIPLLTKENPVPKCISVLKKSLAQHPQLLSNLYNATTISQKIANPALFTALIEYPQLIQKSIMSWINNPKFLEYLFSESCNPTLFAAAFSSAEQQHILVALKSIQTESITQLFSLPIFKKTIEYNNFCQQYFFVNPYFSNYLLVNKGSIVNDINFNDFIIYLAEADKQTIQIVTHDCPDAIKQWLCERLENLDPIKKLIQAKMDLIFYPAEVFPTPLPPEPLVPLHLTTEKPHAKDYSDGSYIFYDPKKNKKNPYADQKLYQVKSNKRSRISLINLAIFNKEVSEIHKGNKEVIYLTASQINRLIVSNTKNESTGSQVNRLIVLNTKDDSKDMSETTRQERVVKSQTKQAKRALVSEPPQYPVIIDLLMNIRMNALGRNVYKSILKTKSTSKKQRWSNDIQQLDNLRNSHLDDLEKIKNAKVEERKKQREENEKIHKQNQEKAKKDLEDTHKNTLKSLKRNKNRAKAKDDKEEIQKHINGAETNYKNAILNIKTQEERRDKELKESEILINRSYLDLVANINLVVDILRLMAISKNCANAEKIIPLIYKFIPQIIWILPIHFFNNPLVPATIIRCFNNYEWNTDDEVNLNFLLENLLKAYNDITVPKTQIEKFLVDFANISPEFVYRILKKFNSTELNFLFLKHPQLAEFVLLKDNKFDLQMLFKQQQKQAAQECLLYPHIYTNSRLITTENFKSVCNQAGFSDYTSSIIELILQARPDLNTVMSPPLSPALSSDQISELAKLKEENQALKQRLSVQPAVEIPKAPPLPPRPKSEVPTHIPPPPPMGKLSSLKKPTSTQPSATLQQAPAKNPAPTAISLDQLTAVKLKKVNLPGKSQENQTNPLSSIALKSTSASTTNPLPLCQSTLFKLAPKKPPSVTIFNILSVRLNEYEKDDALECRNTAGELIVNPYVILLTKIGLIENYKEKFIQKIRSVFITSCRNMFYTLMTDSNDAKKPEISEIYKLLKDVNAYLVTNSNSIEQSKIEEFRTEYLAILAKYPDKFKSAVRKDKNQEDFIDYLSLRTPLALKQLQQDNLKNTAVPDARPTLKKTTTVEKNGGGLECYDIYLIAKPTNLQAKVYAENYILSGTQLQYVNADGEIMPAVNISKVVKNLDTYKKKITLSRDQFETMITQNGGYTSAVTLAKNFDGCEIFLLDALPKKLEEFESKYFIAATKLYYVDKNAAKEIPITDTKKFKTDIDSIAVNSLRISVPTAKLRALIKSTGNTQSLFKVNNLPVSNAPQKKSLVNGR